MISGRTGISGCVDGSMVMIEKQRKSGEPVPYCVGRDIENLELHFALTTHTPFLIICRTANKQSGKKPSAYSKRFINGEMLIISVMKR